MSNKGTKGKGMARGSSAPTPFAVHCMGLMEGHDCGGPIYLTEGEYDRQMRNPDALWKCPRCNSDARWDDDIFEQSVYGKPTDDEART